MRLTPYYVGSVGSLSRPQAMFLCSAGIHKQWRKGLRFRESLLLDWGVTLRASAPGTDAEHLMQELIFDFASVVPMARFVYKVVRAWRWFGRRLPTMVSELAPDTDEEGQFWNFESASDNSSDMEDSDTMMNMEIDNF
ncbi:hypothetical protein R3P38DRAFT_2813905 [Favolaschia claudopus]|uniref:Uncharacterized protein n=1 Tax=Favolaschia claudopus TaxID=2862362 RepID=A0AAV9Z4Q5_9AGAR